MHVPNPILLLTVAVRFSTYAYKCNDIFCPNKVWITEMNNLFWIILELILQLTQQMSTLTVKTKLVPLFQAALLISRKTLQTFEFQVSN